MLVLSRKQNEKIIVNGNIVFTIVDIRGTTVRVGIEAPKEVSIDREEVAKMIEQNRIRGEVTTNTGN